MQLARTALAGVIGFAGLAGAQILPLPVRPTHAPTGDAFVTQISALAPTQREEAIYFQITSGNGPDFLRQLCPITVTNVVAGKTNLATFLVAPDYLAVGMDEDYFLSPMTPLTAQRIADQLGCTLPTPKMVDAIYAAAEVKLAPTPLAPSSLMTTVPIFAEHNGSIRRQRAAHLPARPAGVLVAGHKKDVVICAKLATKQGKVAIYGWHRTNGVAIQPLYLGHTSAWVDYSHGIRLVQQKLIVNGATRNVAEVLADPNLAGLLSDEGVIPDARYPTNTLPADAATSHPPAPRSGAAAISEFKPTGQLGELRRTFPFEPEVLVHINIPAATDSAPDKPILLIFYALPNGNTTAQTIGRILKRGDDWHFDIQHIGAQTRFMRERIINRTVVVAYLEAGSKSWPAWRKQHGDAGLPKLVGSVKRLFPAKSVEIVLTGHSGGGSFTFGYLNACEQIPNDVVRIAFLDSNYAYTTTNHLTKLTHWLKASATHHLCVLAYNDAAALLEGKSFVTATGGTWGRSHTMLRDLGAQFPLTHQTNAGLAVSLALDGRIQFLLKDNPDRKILHTVQVERNGFIHAMLTGTPLEGRGYEYLGPRAYSKWILPE